MKKIILIIITILFSSSVFADHNKYKCSKKESILYGADKVLKDGEIISLPSYTTMGLYNVLNEKYLLNPVTVTGYLAFPKSINKAPVVIMTHGSGGAGSLFTNSYYVKARKNLLEAGIGVMLIDSFCNRGTKDTWRDQSKATMVSQAIDTMMAYQFIKSHPRSNGKIGTNGHSRGGTNSLMVSDVKFTSKFLEGTNGFDAILPEAAECRMAGLFKNAELTKNTKMLYVHGEDDDLTLAKPCAEYVKNIKAKEGQIEIDIKQGWGHDWHSPYKPQKVKAMVMPKCPANYVDDNGVVTGKLADLGLNKYKFFNSWEEYGEAAATEPKKTFKKMFKILKSEKCLKRGAHVGGNHGDEYMPQFINFFKENLL
jgi:dienelactone hydrolase|tara:strand:+ start:65 stop:1168 length:1104 start_codon:yes stop_codon:yes gene_type:complete